MEKPAISFHEAADVFVVESRAPAGVRLVQHAHEHDHLSFLASGIADLTVDGVTTRITGPSMLTIKAGAAHEILPVTPIIWLCLWGSNFGVQTEAVAAVKAMEEA